MKHLLLVLAVIASAGTATAQDVSDSHRAAAHELFAAMNIQESMLENSTAMFDQIPAPPEVKEAMVAFMAELLTWETLEPEVTAIYVNVYSESELVELAAFYATPLGRKLVQTQPQISVEMMTITQRILMENQGRLMELMQAAGNKQ